MSQETSTGRYESLDVNRRGLWRVMEGLKRVKEVIESYRDVMGYRWVIDGL